MSAIDLAVPVGSNFIKDFPAVHSVNIDKLDTHATPQAPLAGAIGQYTPKLSATTTDPVLGSGSEQRGFYYTIWDQVYCWGYVKFGSTGLNTGSGVYTINLPFTAVNTIGFSVSLGLAPIIGNGIVWDDSNPTARMPITINLRTANDMMFGPVMGSAQTVVSDSFPIGWSVNDKISFAIKYQGLVA